MHCDMIFYDIVDVMIFGKESTLNMCEYGKGLMYEC